MWHGVSVRLSWCWYSSGPIVKKYTHLPNFFTVSDSNNDVRRTRRTTSKEGSREVVQLLERVERKVTHVRDVLPNAHAPFVVHYHRKVINAYTRVAGVWRDYFPYRPGLMLTPRLGIDEDACR